MKPLQSTAWLTALLLAAPATATTLTDATGDFLPTYAGPQNGELDLLEASAIRSDTGVQLTARVNGTIGTPGSLYVWGINRGAGTPRLTFGNPSIGQGILFDSVFVMFANGDARVAAFPAIGGPVITNLPGHLTVEGDTISGFLPFSLLPSRGLETSGYRYSLWVRQRANPGADGTNIELADFLPERGGFTANVPEPATWAMMILGFGVVGTAARRRRPAITA